MRLWVVFQDSVGSNERIGHCKEPIIQGFCAWNPLHVCHIPHARILCDKHKVALLWHFRTIEVLWSSYTQTTGLKSAPVLFAWCTERPVSVPKPSPATSSSNGPRVRLCWHKASVPRWMPIFWQFSLATLCFSWLRNIHPTKAKGNR